MVPFFFKTPLPNIDLSNLASSNNWQSLVIINYLWQFFYNGWFLQMLCSWVFVHEKKSEELDLHIVNIS